MKGVIMTKTLPSYHYAFQEEMTLGAKVYASIVVAALIMMIWAIVAPEYGTIANQGTGLDYNLVP